MSAGRSAERPSCRACGHCRVPRRRRNIVWHEGEADATRVAAVGLSATVRDRRHPVQAWACLPGDFASGNEPCVVPSRRHGAVGVGRLARPPAVAGVAVAACDALSMVSPTAEIGPPIRDWSRRLMECGPVPCYPKPRVRMSGEFDATALISTPGSASSPAGTRRSRWDHGIRRSFGFEPVRLGPGAGPSPVRRGRSASSP